MWFQHLQTVQDNRKRGVSKAAKTRRERGLNKKAQNQNTEASYFIVSAVLELILDWNYMFFNCY